MYTNVMLPYVLRPLCMACKYYFPIFSCFVVFKIHPQLQANQPWECLEYAKFEFFFFCYQCDRYSPAVISYIIYYAWIAMQI